MPKCPELSDNGVFPRVTTEKTYNWNNLVQEKKIPHIGVP